MQMHGYELHRPLHLDAYLHCVYRLWFDVPPPVYRTPFARGGSMYPLEVYPPLGGLVVPLA